MVTQIDKVELEQRSASIFMPSPARLTPLNPTKPKNESVLDKISDRESTQLPGIQLGTYSFAGPRNKSKFLTAQKSPREDSSHPIGSISLQSSRKKGKKRTNKSVNFLTFREIYNAQLVKPKIAGEEFPSIKKTTLRKTKFLSQERGDRTGFNTVENSKLLLDVSINQNDLNQTQYTKF